MQNMDNTIEWRAVCGNDSVFWDSLKIFNSSTPVFSQCFQSIVLVWGPCLLYLLIALPYLIYVHGLRTVNKWRDKGAWQYSKLFCLVLLIALSVVEIVIAVISYEDAALYQLISPVIKVITFAVALHMTHVEFAKGLHTSGPLFLLWLLLLICGIVPFYTYIVEPDITDTEAPLVTALFYISYIFIVLEFACNLFADRRALAHEQYGDHPCSNNQNMTDAVHINKHHYRDAETPPSPKPLLGEQAKEETKGRNFAYRPFVSQKLMTYSLLQHRSPENWASVLNFYTHSWITGLLIKGYKKTICFEDLYDLMDKDKSEPIVDVAEKQWKTQHRDAEYKAEVSGRDARSFFWVLTRVSRATIIESGILRFILGIVGFGGPIILHYIINWVTSTDPFVWKGYTLAVAVFLLNLIGGLMQQWYFKLVCVIGMRSRTAIVTAVYTKALRLSSAARKSSTVGEIVNLMSVDAQRVHDMCMNIHEGWASLVFIIVTMYLLWQQIGPSSLAGLVLLVLLAPFNGVYICWQYNKLQEAQMKHKDRRIKCLNEMFGGIKILKMYACSHVLGGRAFTPSSGTAGLCHMTANVNTRQACFNPNVYLITRCDLGRELYFNI